MKKLKKVKVLAIGLLVIFQLIGCGNSSDNKQKIIKNDLISEIENPKEKFKPIATERSNGFYATLDYNDFINDKDIKLEETPSLTFDEIKEVNKTNNENRFEINIVLSEEGAIKFQTLTRENIGLPIAIVIDKQIVSIPKVNMEIVGGNVSISGDFTEAEVDSMIKSLKEK